MPSWFAKARWLLGAPLVLTGALSAGCERRAPGPEQCVRFAELAYQSSVQSLLRSPMNKDLFDALVNTCLTTPFDRKVITCTERRGTPLECLRQYQPELFQSPELDRALPRGLSRQRPIDVL